MNKLKENKAITLIALVITIIVLLILAGVAINSIMGQDSAPQKAADARLENDKGAARDAATIKAAEYVQKYYDEKNVQGNEELIEMTAGEYVAQEMNNQTEGAYKFIVDGMTLKVFSADANVSTDEPIVEGTINDDGTITWNDTTTGGTGNGDGTWTGSITTEEETALAANGMSKLADSNVPSNLKTESVKAVLSGNVPIPAGYTYKEGTSTALESTPTSWGVVIEDDNHNEWVWVPVADASEMYDEIEPTQIGKGKKEENDIQIGEEKYGIKLASVNGIEPLLKVADSSSEEEEEKISYTIEYYKDGNYYESDSRTEYSSSYTLYRPYAPAGYQIDESRSTSFPCDVSDGDVIYVYWVKTEDYENVLKVKATKKSKSNIISQISRGTTNSLSCREPSLLGYDLSNEYYTQAGFNSAADFAEAMVTDYNAMIESVEKYGGFYIGRYELCGSISSPTVKRGDSPLFGRVNWYELYKVCKSFSNASSESAMIYGCQWDMVCKWANDSGDKVSYSTSDSSRHPGGDNKEAGSNESDKRNNVYDLEGNLREWTQEASGSDTRCFRGGTTGNGNYSYAGSRYLGFSWYPFVGTYAYGGDATRPTFYIK